MDEDVIKNGLNIALIIKADFINIMQMNTAVGKSSNKTIHSTTLESLIHGMCTVYNVVPVQCLPRFL